MKHTTKRPRPAVSVIDTITWHNGRRAPLSIRQAKRLLHQQTVPPVPATLPGTERSYGEIQRDAVLRVLQELLTAATTVIAPCVQRNTWKVRKALTNARRILREYAPIPEVTKKPTDCESSQCRPHPRSFATAVCGPRFEDQAQYPGQK